MKRSARSYGIMHLVMILTIVVVAESTPLRGSLSSTVAPLDFKQQRRQLMEKDPILTVPPTEFQTNVPSPSPTSNSTTTEPEAETTMSPSMFFSTSPTVMVPVTSSPNVQQLATETPTTATTTTTTTTAVELTTIRELYPFSIRIQGNLNNETTFRYALQTYLLNSMQPTIPMLQSITLSTTPLPFGNRRLRSLQQATLLAYQGIAILGIHNQDVPTAQTIQRAQRSALEASTPTELESYLSESSSQPITILQLRVADFEPVAYDGPAVTQANMAEPMDEEQGKKTGFIIGIVVAVLVVGVVGGIFVYRQSTKPPPPPPYEFDQDEKNVSLDDVLEINDALKVAITESTSESEGVHSPQMSQPQDATSNDTSDHGMEVIALSNAPKTAKKRGLIDLRRPAKHTQGIESVVEEVTPPQVDSTQAQENDDLDTTFGSIMEIQSIPSNADESMAGYSLATDVPDVAPTLNKPLTPQQLRETVIKDRAASPELDNNVQMRWFAHNPIKVQRQPSASSSSTASPISSASSRSYKITLDAVSDPLRDSLTGEKKDTEVFVDDDDEEVEVVSRASSSYKEDDSLRGSGSVMSGMSDMGEYLEVPGQTDGALGFFYREQEEPFDDFDVLPRPTTTTTTTKMTSPVQDDVSDAPSDERHNDNHADVHQEQDLSGFSETRVLKQNMDGLNAIMGDVHRSEFLKSDGSWDESPEMMEAWIRERRRMKRQTRNRREERKQPPVTMEI